MSDSQLIDKGGRMEEYLRNYFLESGYFVVRGAKFTFDGREITDVDLWLYQRTSTFRRERFNVDAKNRRSPHALERILWAKGLQQSLRLDGALVATTDTRNEMREFGRKNDTVILDGSFLQRLRQRYSSAANRMSEEEMVAAVWGGKSDRIGGEWLDRTEEGKSRVLTHLDFDGCNAQLLDIKFFAEQVSLVSSRKEVACRLCYYSLSLTLITLDFLVRDFAFIERPLQIAALNNGLRFGVMGEQGAEKVFFTAARIASALLPGQNIRPAELAKQFHSESMQLPVEILSEIVLKTNQTRSLFDYARAFEALAFNRIFESPLQLSPDHKGLLGAILDFHRMDRRKFFDAFAVDSGGPPGHVQNELQMQQVPKA